MRRPTVRIAMLLVVLSLAVQAFAATRSYPLRVRGGGRLRVWGEPTKSQGLVKLIVEFNFGNRAASAGLRPGEGSWMDRGQRPGEPNRLEYFTAERDAQSIVDYLRSNGNYYTFECFNTGRGYLQVTKAYVKSVRFD